MKYYGPIYRTIRSSYLSRCSAIQHNLFRFSLIRMIYRRRSIIAAISAISALAYLVFIQTTTPPSWRWTAMNLQVHLRTESKIRMDSGKSVWSDSSIGWTKLEYFFLLRKCTWTGEEDGVPTIERIRLIKASRSGITISVGYGEQNEKPLQAILLVPNGSKAEVRLNDRTAAWAEFEPS
jgi:hypothetical protein